MAYKQCPKCNTDNGVRALKCKKCDTKFLVRKGVTKRIQKRNGEKVNWHDLLPGDYIKVLAQGGPYYELEDGERVSMSYSGYFKVIGKDNKGILCRKADNKLSGTYHIYMSKPEVYPSGTIMVSHRIRKVDPNYVREIEI